MDNDDDTASIDDNEYSLDDNDINDTTTGDGMSLGANAVTVPRVGHGPPKLTGPDPVPLGYFGSTATPSTVSATIQAGTNPTPGTTNPSPQTGLGLSPVSNAVTVPHGPVQLTGLDLVSEPDPGAARTGVGCGNCVENEVGVVVQSEISTPTCNENNENGKRPIDQDGKF